MLCMSPETDKLFEALAKAQAEIETADKDSVNPHFDKTYADLASVWKACRAALSKQGISVTQWPIPAAKPNHVALLTRVSLGAQWAMSGMEMPVDPPANAQRIGSSLTYLRRYMLAAVAGVAPDEDDDGNAGSGRKPKPAPEQNTRTPSPGRPSTGPQGHQRQGPGGPSQGAVFPPAGGPSTRDQGPPVNQQPLPDVTLVSTAQLTRLFAIAGKHGWTSEYVKEYVQTRWKLESTTELTRTRYDALVELVQKKDPKTAYATILKEPQI